ncbi:MAG: hypothetical protein US57_C0014G0022 [Candidatus Moranbacteria bacterium GW2011_GWC2_37_73]|nr:MAG: hypothetical protein UR95_C0002G0042 [Parcubacteria group bacterium GW2011_GWC1_36_108]KKP99904.1 MAG: hypothetical protein US09_C0029G0007 [Candidatus Moranbacteria bacterium GW2011_GWD1_36_198]KKQ00163.1 MAG: hypothetical protein US10_C0039G0003 [Candidatus Moranbacteria bacterium GW2011_GWD2_36_198]KKQ39399.1 MAG: hypothetical protein US57_C0014G0022 [Candidatus Moranbacteria bacterium GW2011_GWC2_37_73]HAS00064.1 hypothetical protein [Candidatus Moranbacteria bacterium]
MEAFKLDWYEERFRGSVRCGAVVIAKDEEQAINMVLDRFGERISKRDKEHLKDSIKKMGWGEIQFFEN